MKKRHLVRLKEIIQSSLEAHKMADWSNTNARSTVAGMIMKRFSRYITEQEKEEK